MWHLLNSSAWTSSSHASGDLVATGKGPSRCLQVAASVGEEVALSGTTLSWVALRPTMRQNFPSLPPPALPSFSSLGPYSLHSSLLHPSFYHFLSTLFYKLDRNLFAEELVLRACSG